jgi:hypothetical protein
MSIAKHYETGESLPEEVYLKLLAARTFRAGSLSLRQVSTFCWCYFFLPCSLLPFICGIYSFLLVKKKKNFCTTNVNLVLGFHFSSYSVISGILHSCSCSAYLTYLSLL